MTAMLDIIRQVVREELAARRGPMLGTVTSVPTHEDKDDTANYEADVRLKHDGLELKQVPMAVSHLGAAVPPRLGDLVMVQFLDHDLQQPFVTGRFYHEADRPPLYKEDDVLFEHRVPGGKLNQLRFAADGSIFLQSDVTKPEDNSEFKAGLKIDPDGVIELQMGDKVLITLKDGEIDIKSDGSPIKIQCDEMTVDGKLTVTGEAKLKDKLKVGTGTGVLISGTEITGGPV
jgi:phage baseplate assembly protein gpV